MCPEPLCRAVPAAAALKGWRHHVAGLSIPQGAAFTGERIFSAGSQERKNLSLAVFNLVETLVHLQPLLVPPRTWPQVPAGPGTLSCLGS